jgi:hypothetical protein
MFRIIFIVLLVLLAIPFVNKGKEYWDEKVAKAKVIGQSLEKTARYAIESGKEK